MSYQERKAILSVISDISITVLFSAFMVQRYPQADLYSPEIFRFWGAFFIILILVSIAATIVITIVFSILNTIMTREMEPAITDERDKIIELRAARNGLYVFALGVMVGMGALVAGLPPAAMFICLVCGGLASEIVSDVSRFFFYRRGF